MTKLQLFVYTQRFLCSTNCDFNELITEEILEKQLENDFCKYWEKYGYAIVLEHWNLEYKNYLEPVNENEKTNINETLQNNSELENQYDALVNSVEEQCDVITDAWQDLWTQLYVKIYTEQYNYYSAVYQIYAIELKSKLVCGATTFVEEEESDDAVADISETVTDELQQLQLLGLPTAFGGRQQVKRRQRTNESYCDYNYFSDFLSDEEEESNSPPSTEMSATENVCDEIDNDALHHVKIKINKKKVKINRKLRKVPQFMLEDKGMLRYWQKRFSLFSRFDEGIRLDRESWFSVTPEKIAKHIAERLTCDIIIDGFCGCGGNAIQFAKKCHKVIAIDIDPLKVEMAKHNARIYGVEHKIDFIVGDFLQLSKNGKLRGDIVFLSPPWGGPKYKKEDIYDLERFLLPVGAMELMEHAHNISDNIALFLPRNSNVQQIIKLAGVGKQCQLEHNFLDTRLVAITAMYGDCVKLD